MPQKQLQLLHKQGLLELSLTFAMENKLSLKEFSKSTNEYDILYPNTVWY